MKNESTLSNTGSRILLPLPVPSPLPPPAPSRSSTSSGTFDSGPPPPVVPGVTAPNATPGIPVTQTRLSPDSTPLTRLPSITPDGLLIEAGGQDQSPPKLQRLNDSLSGYGLERLGALPTSPSSQTSLGGWFPQPHASSFYADSGQRDNKKTVFPWLMPSPAETVQH